MLEQIKISGFSDEISSNFSSQLETVNKLNMKYLCLRTIDQKNIADFTVQEFKQEVYPKLEEAHVGVSSLGSPIGKIKITDEEAFEKQCTQLHELCKIAKLVECKYIRIFSFYVGSSNQEQHTEEVIRKLQIFIGIAALYDIVLLHENEKDIYGDTIARCLLLAERCYCENFKLIFDFANFVQVQEDVLKAYEVLKPYIEYIHIKDATYRHHENVICGTGDGKIKEILWDAIQSENYRGFLTLEPHLVVFDSLQSLELEDANELVKNNNGYTGAQAYEIQYNALVTLLKER